MEKSFFKYVGLLIGIIFIIIPKSSKSQHFSFFEIENLSNINSKVYYKPQVNIYANSFKTQHHIGFYYFSLLNENWGQAYGGIIYKPAKWLSVSVGAGLEVNKNPYRFNINFKITKNKFNFNQIYEYGGSGFWYHILLNYQIKEQNYIGLILKRYYGAGINYEYRIMKSPLSFIISPTFDYEDKNYKLAITFRYYL